jgi:hypothetical protein
VVHERILFPELPSLVDATGEQKRALNGAHQVEANRGYANGHVLRSYAADQLRWTTAHPVVCHPRNALKRHGVLPVLQPTAAAFHRL